MKITAIALCLGIFALAIAGTIRISQAKAMRRGAALIPTTVTVCKQVEDNGDADHTQGGTFGFIVSDQAITLGSPSLTRVENQSANPPVCSAPIAIPGGSTQLQVVETSFPPTSTWPRNEAGYPLWTATDGVTTINGSGQTALVSGAAFSGLSGNITVTFNNRVGRTLTLCKLVQPNAVAPNNQGDTWTFLTRFQPIEASYTARPIIADETSGTVCLPPINIPLGVTQIVLGECLPHLLVLFPGYPKFAWTTTDGQSANSTSVPMDTTSGDITVTITNKYDEPRVLSVCNKLLDNGDAINDKGDFYFMTSLPQYPATSFWTPNVAEGGATVCSTLGSIG